MGSFGVEYFDENPSKKVSSLDEIIANVPVEFSKEIDENVSHETKSNLIKSVFDNFAKKSITKTKSFADGGSVEKEGDYTPYEYLHELLPKVYKQNGFERYVVSDEEGEKINQEIEKNKADLENDIKAKLEEEGADSLYELSADDIEKFNKRKKNIENQQIFITESELEAYVLTNPHLDPKNYVKNIKNSLTDLLDKGLVCVDYNEGNIKYVYKYQYISGNVYDKLTDLQLYREELKQYLTDEQLRYQYSILQKAKRPLSRINTSNVLSIYLHPYSHFCTDINVFSLESDDFKDWENNNMNKVTIQLGFINWLDYAQSKGIILPQEYKGTSLRMIKEIFIKNDFPSEEITALSQEITDKYSDPRVIKEKLKKAINTRKEKIQKLGEPLFSKFLNQGLTNDAKQRLELIWNQKYNCIANPIYHKIPVATSFSRTFKDNAKFIPNPTQIQSVQFMEFAKSGLLAYGVGVGKTASSILNVAHALTNNKAKYPLFIVPKPTYQKWIMEMKGGRVKVFTVTYMENGVEDKLTFEDEKKANRFARKVNGKVELTKDYYSKGLLPEGVNLVEIGNLNWSSYVEGNLKTYSEEDYEKINKINDGINFLKLIQKEYETFSLKAKETVDFSGFKKEHAEAIQSYFPFFDNDEFTIMYNTYQSLFKFDPESGKVPYAKKNKLLPTELLIKGIDDQKVGLYSPPLNKRVESMKYSLGEYKTFPENTVFIGTFFALTRISIEDRESDDFDEEIGHSFAKKIVHELSQGEDLDDLIAAKGGNTLSNKVLDKIYGTKETAEIFISNLNVDYLVVDESHFFKKVFTDTKGKKEKYGSISKQGTIKRIAKKYSLVDNAPQPSQTAISLYILTRYIQTKNALETNEYIGGNVCHLTATPFTNSPLEVYSMMALTNMDFLKKSGISHIEDFFDVFMKIEYAMRYKASKITKEQVLVGYNNSPQMKSFIYAIMDYKNGEDANIKRPDRYVIPNEPLGISAIIRPTDEQVEIMRDIKKYMRGEITLEDVCSGASDEVDVEELSDEQLINIIIEQGTESQQQKYSELDEMDDVLRKEAESIVSKIFEKDEEESEEDLSKQEMAQYRTLKGISYMKQITLSPYLLQCKKERDTEPSYYDYVQSSPKILYTLGCIKSTHEFEDANNLKRSGIVIYMNIGVHPSATVPVGNPVGINKKGEPVYGEYKKKKWNKGAFEKIKMYLIEEMGYKDSDIVIVSGQQTPEQKESAKNKFLNGDAVVLIGSSTISTGVDLQNNASSLFMCAFDWNPTDNEQIAGRIHRQGNPFEKVRICYPMISDSVDPLIFQMLQEKDKRIKAIWDKDGVESSLNLEDVDYASMQEDLITDPEDRLEIWFEKTSEKIQSEIEEIQQKNNILKNSYDSYMDYNTLIIPLRKTLSVIDHFKKYQKQQEGIENVKLKISEITLKTFDDELDAEGNVIKDGTTLMVEAIAKVKKDSYDYEKDPDGRYVVIDFDNEIDDELAKKIKNQTRGMDSWIQRINNWQNDKEKQLLNRFLNEKYPEYLQGKWISESEAKELEDKINSLQDEVNKIANESNILKQKIEDTVYQERDEEDAQLKKNLIEQLSELKKQDSENNILFLLKKEELNETKLMYDSLYGGLNILNFNSNGFIERKLAGNWYDAWRDLKIKSRVLEGWGLNSKDIGKARVQIAQRLDVLQSEFDNLERQRGVMLVKFTEEFNNSRVEAPKVKDLVQQFSSVNDIFLGKDYRLNTFDEDKSKTISLINKKDVKPKVDENYEIEDAEIIENSEQIDTFVDEEETSSKIQEYHDSIEGYVMLLDLADTSEEIDLIYETIEGYLELLELEGESEEKINQLKKELNL